MISISACMLHCQTVYPGRGLLYFYLAFSAGMPLRVELWQFLRFRAVKAKEAQPSWRLIFSWAFLTKLLTLSPQLFRYWDVRIGRCPEAESVLPHLSKILRMWVHFEVMAPAQTQGEIFSVLFSKINNEFVALVDGGEVQGLEIWPTLNWAIGMTDWLYI